jgi:hypothetical protein
MKCPVTVHAGADTSVEELLRAVLAAPPDLRSQALGVLEGRARAVELDAQPDADAEGYASLREVARHWGVYPCTVWRWDRPSHNVGGRRRFKLSEVADYLASEAFQRRQAALRAERRLKRAGATDTESGGIAAREEVQ